MDIKKFRNGIIIFIQKYKYVALILIIGIALMLMPDSSNTKTVTQTEAVGSETQNVQKELEEILSCIRGAGEVKVLLTEQSGEEIIYQMDSDLVQSENSTSSKLKVVTVTDTDRSEHGLIQQINPPCYMGAIILCQGADDPSLKLAITSAVSKITGLGTDKIAVLKMK